MSVRTPYFSGNPTSFRGAANWLGRKMDRGFFSQSWFRLNGEKSIVIKQRPLIPALIAGFALLYNHAYQSNQSDGDRQAWLKGVLEAGLSQLVVENTNLFPLWSLGLAVYRAGQKPNRLEMLQEAVKTGTIMSLGCLGIYLGSAVSNSAKELEEGKMYELLNHPSIDDWLNSERIKNGDEQVKAFAESVRALRDRSKTAYRTRFKVEHNAAKPLKKELDQLKVKLAGLLGQIDRKAILPDNLPASSRFRMFSKILQESQHAHVRLVRSLNPMFGYLIMGLLVGTPLAKLINQRLAERYPQLKQQQAPQIFSPFMLNKLPHMSGLPGAKQHGSHQEDEFDGLSWALSKTGGH